MLLKKRPWAEDISVDGAWKKPGRLARHRPYFYYTDEKLYPCDRHGFRIPAGHRDIREKYAASAGQHRVFCFGGSTTFGAYCDYLDTYPALLEQQIQTPCFNLGLQSFDSYCSMLMLVDVLREGLVPDSVIFLDGINENTGYYQGTSGEYDEYIPTFRQYIGFRDLVLNGSIKYRLKRLIGRLISNSGPPQGNDGGIVAQHFIDEQAQSYLDTQRFVARICQGFDIKPLFFLQPVVWDTWPKDNSGRYDYQKRLYERINDDADNLSADLSGGAGLKPDMFFDWAHMNAAGHKMIAGQIAAHWRHHAS